MQPNIGLAPLRPRFWAVIVVMGVLVGLAAAALMALLRIVEHAAYAYQYGVFLYGVERAPGWRRVVVLTLTGAFGGFAMWLVQRASRGRSANVDESVWRGTGSIPALQGLAVSVISMIVVGGGAALGRERSVKDTGAVIGSKLADVMGLTPDERRILTAFGSAAGMGAVYNMPIGGALFGLEVLLGDLSLRLAMPALALGGIATCVSWVYLPAHPTYLVPSYGLWLPQIVWAVLAAPLIGVISAAYVRLVDAAQRRKARGNALLVAPVVVLAILGALAIPYPELLGNGKDVVELAFTGSLTGGIVLVLAVLRPLSTAGCLASGLPGGLFTPTLTLGALVGAAFGGLWNALWPGTPLGTYAVIGAGAMVGAATQGPVSAVVMLIELTGTTNPLIVPLVLATAIATVTSRLLVRGSIYSRIGGRAEDMRTPPGLPPLERREMPVSLG